MKIKVLLELHWEGKLDDQTFLNAASFVKKGYDVLDAVDKAIEMWD